MNLSAGFLYAVLIWAVAGCTQGGTYRKTLTVTGNERAIVRQLGGAPETGIGSVSSRCLSKGQWKVGSAGFNKFSLRWLKDTAASFFLTVAPVENGQTLLVLELPGTQRKELRAAAEGLAACLAEEWSGTQGLYGMNIQTVTVRDTLLFAVRQAFAHPPDPERVGKMISLLYRSARENGVAVTGYPMLHTEQEGSNYHAMVALPVDRLVTPAAPVLIKRMITGRLLEAEVRGGPARVAEAQRALENYVSDHQLISPALPYQVLVSDRSSEKDTSRWITRLYYPIT